MTGQHYGVPFGFTELYLESGLAQVDRIRPFLSSHENSQEADLSIQLPEQLVHSESKGVLVLMVKLSWEISILPMLVDSIGHWIP